MTVPVVRKRAKRPKTRTGCRTCRQRHIKCDEERPACRRCRASGRECPGYDQPPRPDLSRGQATLLPKAFRHGTSGSLTPAHDSLLPRGPSPLPGHMSDAESQAFDFFREQTVRQLPGSPWTLSWERLALQMGHHEPAVTHAAIALGAIHRALSERLHACGGLALMQQHLQQFALTQYNKSMGHLCRHIEALERGCSESDVEVVLLTSLLFFCFEVLHGEDARATMHLHTGLRVLYERVRTDAPSCSSSSLSSSCCAGNGGEDEDGGEAKRIVTMYVTPRNNMDLILQTFVRLDSDLTIVREDEPYLFPVCYESLPASFSSLEEAMVHLDAIGCRTDDFCRDIVALADHEIMARRADCDTLDDELRNCLACAASRTVALDGRPDLVTRMDDIKRDLHTWMGALACLALAAQDESAQLLTQIHFFYVWFVVSTWRDADEMLVDRFEDQFHHMIGLAERYVELHHNSASFPSSTVGGRSYAASTRQAFSLGTDLVPAIAMIAFKSRTSSVRRRCVSLLRSINLQGVFDNHFLASFVEHVWTLEERRARSLSSSSSSIGPLGSDLLASQVPGSARFVEIALCPTQREQRFYKADVGRLVYATHDSDGTLQIAEELFRVHRPRKEQQQQQQQQQQPLPPLQQTDEMCSFSSSSSSPSPRASSSFQASCSSSASFPLPDVDMAWHLSSIDTNLPMHAFQAVSEPPGLLPTLQP